eukprot:4201271-Prymnesium_polylepis.1
MPSPHRDPHQTARLWRAAPMWGHSGGAPTCPLTPRAPPSEPPGWRRVLTRAASPPLALACAAATRSEPRAHAGHLAHEPQRGRRHE